jgi:hypothetical protein
MLNIKLFLTKIHDKIIKHTLDISDLEILFESCDSLKMTKEEKEAGRMEYKFCSTQECFNTRKDVLFEGQKKIRLVTIHVLPSKELTMNLEDDGGVHHLFFEEGNAGLPMRSRPAKRIAPSSKSKEPKVKKPKMNNVNVNQSSIVGFTQKKVIDNKFGPIKRPLDIIPPSSSQSKPKTNQLEKIPVPLKDLPGVQLIGRQDSPFYCYEGDDRFYTFADPPITYSIKNTGSKTFKLYLAGVFETPFPPGAQVLDLCGKSARAVTGAQLNMSFGGVSMTTSGKILGLENVKEKIFI